MTTQIFMYFARNVGYTKVISKVHSSQSKTIGLLVYEMPFAIFVFMVNVWQFVSLDTSVRRVYIIQRRSMVNDTGWEREE